MIGEKINNFLRISHKNKRQLKTLKKIFNNKKIYAFDTRLDKIALEDGVE